MQGGFRVRTGLVLAFALFLAACNLPVEDLPTATATLTLAEIEAIVGAALLEEAAQTETAAPSDTPTPQEPSATPSDTPEPPTETPTATPTDLPKCTVISNFLNLRAGPGLPYDPPLRTVTSGTMLFPFARNSDGSWLEGRLEGESLTFWFSAAGQFVECNREPLNFGLGVIPPTPTPTNTFTPAPTSTPTATIKPSPTNTSCPKFTNPSIQASTSPGSTTVGLTWGSQGGCGPITGTITATIKGEDSPYQTYSIKGGSGKLTDKSPSRGCTSWDVVYALTLKDSSGQTLTTSTSVNLYIIC